MRPEEACVQGIYRAVGEEAAFVDTILRTCCGDPSGEAASQPTSCATLVSVPPINTSVSSAEVTHHQETMAALREEIAAVDVAVQTQIDRMKDQYAAAYSASARAWEQTVGDATRKLQASEAAFERARAEAENRFNRDRDAMDHLRDRELQAVRDICAAPQRLVERKHRAQNTHMLTKKMVPPRCYQAADDILQWLQTSGRQTSHAAGRVFELQGDGCPAVLVKASHKDLASLHLALTSTPAAAWQNLREAMARMISTMVNP